jgi:hypothetical protein
VQRVFICHQAKPPVMQQSSSVPYNRISLFFVLILAVITWGFYKTYIIFFPSFEGFTFIQHFHGAMMMTWMLFLIIQPLLIRYNKVHIHKAIGKLSYVVAPVLMASIFLAARLSYLRPMPGMPHEDKIAEIALSFPYIFAFGILYCLAIINRRNTYHHMRYMIGTSLLMIGPGLGRALIVYYNYTLPEAVRVHDYVIIGIAAALMIYDMLKKNSYRVFAIVSIVIICIIIIWESRHTQAWQTVGEFIAKNLFS